MDNITLIPWDQITPGNNDRTNFDKDKLAELADSIRDVGLVQPITVRLFAPDPRCVFGGDRWGDMAQYQIVAGERRYRAMRILEWEEIPCIVKELDDETASAVMLSENVSRADLDPIDEANAYKYRIEFMGWTVSDCAKRAGVSEVRVQFRLKLLALREDIQQLVRSGNLPLGYAQILSDARLDRNRQMMAFSNYRDNPRPTLGWFRSVVNEYAEQQNQASMFEDAFMVCQSVPASVSRPADPPSPATHTPDVRGKDAKDTILKLIEYWELAAQEWEKIGKPFKRQECKAASSALQQCYSAIQ
ncbi:MAG: ParB/RepB/Spo0J family partition protein [Bryobacterales bacterium]|nr:ParB/RepB/Spo0J family partition protein [Bryobacterales bacterium]